MPTAAIWGAGSIAHTHAEALRACGIPIAAVVSRRESAAGEFAARWGITRFGTDPAILFEDGIDCIHICTPPNLHYEMALECLNHGKHVLCEKAMVLTEADAREAFALAKEKGKFLMEAMWSRFLPQYQTARRWIEEGRIGAIQSAACSIGFRANQNPEGRILNPKLAGGALYDIGVYAIEPLTYLIGEPVEDVLGVWRPHSVTGVDERVTAILRFPCCDAVIQATVAANPREYYYISGDKGFIELPFVTFGDRVRLYDGNRNLVEEVVEPWENGFVYEIQEVIRCIREGKLYSETMPPEATIECAQIFDKILR